MTTFTPAERGGFSTRVSQLELEYFEVDSDITGGRFAVSVSVPDGYDPTGPALPVVYALDAQWHGGGYEKLHRALTAPESVRRARPFVQVNIGYLDDGIDPIIVRNRDLVPPGEGYPEWMPSYIRDHIGKAGQPASEEQQRLFFEWLGNPRADLFLRFLEEELHPRIREEYRVADEDAGLFGFSYGALFAIYALLSASPLFRNYGAGSPGILVQDSRIFPQYDEFRARPADGERDLRLHVTMATNEMFGPVDLYRVMSIETLRFLHTVRSNPAPGLTLSEDLIYGEDHETAAFDAYRSFIRACYPA